MPVYLSNASSLHSLTITLFYQSKYLEHINDIEDHKIIILQMHGRHFEAYIERSMDEKAIYEALQIVLSSELDNNLDGNQCIIYDSVRNRRARLHYDEMNPNIIYTVEPTFSHVHGSKAGSGAARKTTHNISHIIQNWELQDADDIFSPEITPRQEEGSYDRRSRRPLLHPLDWGRSFTDKLRALSFKSQGRHLEAVELVQAEGNARCEGDESEVLEAVNADIVAATAKWAKNMEQEGVDVGDDKNGKGVLRGGVKEDVEDTEDGGGHVGWAYEQDGSFKIGTHFR
ncbi:hypothetical protein PtrSN002B_000646 [Pyrenophora tritici-repentis]|uniref:Amelogenin domain containing protein n=2 Tax=Pyrenophora tritici-repentis TaxID=45151 RepID=A0A2W1EMG8_9PLEO|nr:uncharacterized protein PTRG_03572 [Pyrenophora tritici-repentis Pt-1C-BFP]KAA8620375.1 hypothetical protein PtrV1_07469 [Pyrenophora tritici-repentis]EDU46410.1 predicted protein [Pyrenophora tritici-repentis Pt-1C-BFP]KAF7448533.1 hypothetical protein A1F99_078970 [Pyrenophora tritici-repentis]KAF7572256.1 Amelogenin domain containing protein [Pyrenophora tritici-repentis]KAG9384567.1 hypothetical protein A1F94_004114 [Pyrenophora tritici-repentis]